jgi:hypothetical protein
VCAQVSGASEIWAGVRLGGAGTVPGVTQSSEAQTERLPVVGALQHPPLPHRENGVQAVRVRVRVPLEVLEATSAGLRGLDEQHRREITETPPPLPF